MENAQENLFWKNNVEPNRKKKKDSGCKVVYVCVLLIHRADVPREKLSGNDTACPLLKGAAGLGSCPPMG